jgi:hypothetical protein
MILNTILLLASANLPTAAAEELIRTNTFGHLAK